jgi:peptidoglycan/xylan/chitin deacetylase (PgdA/CDA1 family)
MLVCARHPIRAAVAAAALSLLSCTAAAPHASWQAPPQGTTAALRRQPAHASQRDGHAFPEKVLALTWDDGPDLDTLPLARYLHQEGISATFFVVESWHAGLSSDPGSGRGVYATGYSHLPVLEELVALGHRIGNHTLHHVLLADAQPARVVEELRGNQSRIDPYLYNELRLFRVPGGAWSSAASAAIDADPLLGPALGPIRWDIDRKDWDNSVACRSDQAALECERRPGGGSRVKPTVTAQRYLATTEEVGRGVVLLHDRVGDVGSSYALDVAKALVPALKARGFVFAAPVLQFSPPALRLRVDDAPRPSRVHFADVDGDHHDDVCMWTDGGLSCALSAEVTGVKTDRRPRAVFRPPSLWDRALSRVARPESIVFGDVDGDKRADVCAPTARGISCALAGSGAFEPPRVWAAGARREGATLRLADVDGDGRADVCERTPAGIIRCARSTGAAFGPWSVWGESPDADSFALADVDGDGRADLCVAARGAVACSPSDGHRFARARVEIPMFGVMPRFADVNGDHRADVCESTAEGIACALSTGHGFTRPTLWMRVDDEDAPETRGELADLNGDGRGDWCFLNPSGIACGLAP